MTEWADRKVKQNSYRVDEVDVHVARCFYTCCMAQVRTGFWQAYENQEETPIQSEDIDETPKLSAILRRNFSTSISSKKPEAGG